jgi:ABC-type multidrug transport system ATPase subunit
VRIEAREVRKRFGANPALNGVSFTIEPGARVALIGPNGSGKSTLNRALLGLLRCEGELRVDSRDPARDRALLAREIAYVPQAAPQLAASVGEVAAAVCGVRGIARARVEALTQRLGLALDEIAARPFRGLSGGMKQKLLVALALAARPRLLVLDEPTGSLDAESRARVLEAIAEQPPETTLVLCSHRLEEVRKLASEVLVLEEGRVARRGPLGDYLDDTLVSVLDVTLAAPPKGEAELLTRGFKPLSEGRYSRLVGRREKARVVAELAQWLGAQLGDLEVRDVEHGAHPERRDA